MDEREFRDLLAERGLELDEGNLIQGPFIPDGMWRVYDPETRDVKAQGRGFEAVMANYL